MGAANRAILQLQNQNNVQNDDENDNTMDKCWFRCNFASSLLIFLQLL